VLTTAYPANSRKPYFKVCNNAIKHRLFAFNCRIKKDQNNTQNSSEWTSFGAVKTLRQQRSTIPFKMYHVLLSRAPASETYFTFFSPKVPSKIIFTTLVPCYYCVTWYVWLGQLFSLLYSHLRWSFCGVMLLHVSRYVLGILAIFLKILSFVGSLLGPSAFPCLCRSPCPLLGLPSVPQFPSVFPRAPLFPSLPLLFPKAPHPRKPRAKVFLLSSKLKRAISSVQNSTAGARHVWLLLCSAHLHLSFDLWSWHVIGRAWNNFKGPTCV